MIRIERVDMGNRVFARELRSLPREIREQAVQSISSLTANPMPARIRFEKLSSYKNPSIYTIHITHNHSHKASFELISTTARMRRVGTHKEIDRAP